MPADVATKVKGDRYCATVATAAVIAKVTRDRLMVELGAQPQYEPYEWAHNKGYGSAAHRDAIADSGPATCTASPGISSDIRHLIRSPRLR